MDINSKLAEQFDQLAELITAISGTFRSTCTSGSSAPVDAKVAKPKPPAKPPAKVETGSDEEFDLDTVRDLLQRLVESRGKDVMVKALKSVGAERLADVDESEFATLVAEANRLMAEDAGDDDEEEVVEAKKPAAKKTKAAPKKAGPTLDDVTAAAKALIEADKAAFVKLSKKLGKPSEMDESVYAEAVAAYVAAMPAEDADEEDDLL